MIFKNIASEPKQILSSMNYSLIEPGHVVHMSDRDVRHSGGNMRFFHQVVEVYEVKKVDEIPETKEATVEAPVIKEPVVEAPVVEEPVKEEPESVKEEPEIEEPVKEEPEVEKVVEEGPQVEETVKTTLEKDVDEKKVLATESEER